MKFNVKFPGGNSDDLKKKVLDAMVSALDDSLDQFLSNVHRAEADEDPHIYLKAVRSTLIALGYPDDYVNGKFYEYALTQYPYNGGIEDGSWNT